MSFRELKFCVSFLSNKKSEFLLSLSSYIHSSLTNNNISNFTINRASYLCF